MIFRTRLALFLGASLAAVAAINAADWPQWRGPTRDGHVPAGLPVPASLPTELKVEWRSMAGDGLASPVVANGRLFYLDHEAGAEMVRCVEAKDGKAAWSHRLDDVFKDSQSNPGPRCTPLVDEDRVYVQSCRGELRCLRSTNGQLVWRAHFVTNFNGVFIGEKGQAAGAARHGYNGQPILDGDHLIALAGGTNGAGIVCLDKRTGKAVWKSQNDTAAYAPPILASPGGRRQLIAFMVESLLGLDPATGARLWRVPLKTTFGRHATTPVVVDDTVIVSSHEFGMIGTRINTGNPTPSAAIAWTNKAAAVNFASPVAAGRHVYGVGPNKNLVCVEAATGALAWSAENFFTSAAGKAHAGLVVMGGNVLVLTDSGELVLVAADPRAFRELGRAQVCGNNWCNPAYADGKLYLRDSRQVLRVGLLP